MSKSHTAILCSHSTSEIRKRIISAIASSSAIDNTTGEILISALVTAVVGATVTIMHEHADEIATEYKDIIRRMK